MNTYPLQFFTLRYGFDCVFDERKQEEAYADFFERTYDTIGHSFYNTGRTRPSTPQSRGLLRHLLSKRMVGPHNVDILDAEPDVYGYEGRGALKEGLGFFSARGAPPECWSSQRLFLDPSRGHLDLLSRTLDLTRHVTIQHGVGGFTLAPAVGDYEGQPEVAYPFCKRHPGAIFWTYEVRDAKRGIRDTNWLTLVTNSILKKAGGIAAARKKLSAEVTLHEVKDGWLFQAGPEPLLGDRENPVEDFRLYSEVARFLKPCRDKTTRWGPFEGYPFSHEQMLRWIARFDDGPYLRADGSAVPMTPPPPPLSLEDEAAFIEALEISHAADSTPGMREMLESPAEFRSYARRILEELRKDPARAETFRELLRTGASVAGALGKEPPAKKKPRSKKV